MMKVNHSFLKLFCLLSIGLILSCVTYCVALVHLSTLPQPSGLQENLSDTPKSYLIPKPQSPINQLVLVGSPYQRGLMTGRLMKNIMAQQEEKLMSEFNHFFSNPILRYSFIFSAMRWFWGVDEYIDKNFLEQMYGTSRAGLSKYNHLLDRYTRQLAYHGIHEIGQAFVDIEREDYGCTLFGLKHQGSWLIGRNFDFEVGRIFDEQKTIQWHLPNEGNAYVSIIWAGMVGAVTGINEHGVYISINAAGSRDFRRYGTPTTLVVTKALQTAKNAEEAVDIIKASKIFITDTFTVSDGGNLYQIEKSPNRTKIHKISSNHVVTNHLSDPVFKKDTVNQYRQRDLTTKHRFERGQQLIESYSQNNLNDKQAELKILEFLRDKKNLDGKNLHLGNRRAIDSLIASHSVIYNSNTQSMFVSEGPSLIGSFHGFDLKKSFARRKPIPIYSLPVDSEVSEREFYQLKKSLKLTSDAQTMIRQKNCEEARKKLQQANALNINHAGLSRVWGDLHQCLGDKSLAKKYWQEALELIPAYRKQITYLNEVLNN